ncbi:hypothetical protein [Kitasatospora sp. SUK 42]|uniref:hypothetical protein n=1 Tax=Kitasatospora sp. SUK 42 TaxID=1588882 RepID=UPI0018CA7B54|nr:hypothetical protein [Kitasatospora sp. SUK 42]MBV2151919.1 hypothetical protein [Kitasatospora sp. SUK 42]
MWIWTTATWMYVLCPPACWAALVRTRVVGAVVGAVLTGWAVLLIGLMYGWWALRTKAEIETGYQLIAILVIAEGAWVERFLRGPRPKERETNRFGGAVAALTGALLISAITAVFYPVINSRPFFPRRSELPLPPGLSIRHDSGTGGTCGDSGCLRELDIAGPDGLPPTEIAARLRAALLADGWTPESNGSLEHRHGWLLDRRMSHAGITVGPTGVTVELAGPGRPLFPVTFAPCLHYGPLLADTRTECEGMVDMTTFRDDGTETSAWRAACT